ncbi:hypothetical protein ACHAW6_009655 [Cyclotella cf. meneghiniana]
MRTADNLLNSRMGWCKFLIVLITARISAAVHRYQVKACYHNSYYSPCFGSYHRAARRQSCSRLMRGSTLHMVSPSPRQNKPKQRTATTKKLASLSSTPFPSTSSRHNISGISPKRLNATWSEDLDFVPDEKELQNFASKSPFPIMPSSLFINLAQSQFELLSHSLVHTSIVDNDGDKQSNDIKPGMPKTSSMVLYLPKENQLTGQLEFVTAVTYPNPSSERVFIASDSSGNGPQQPHVVPPVSALRLPGFTSARDLIPSYPFISAAETEETLDMKRESGVMLTTMTQDNSIGVSVVEEISAGDSKSSTPNSLSVTMFSGLDTLGVLMIWPYESSDDKQNKWTWTRNDKLQVSRAAKSLALALSMDNERASTQIRSEQIRMAFADSLHQVKSPIQALRTFGKLLQRQLAEEAATGPTMSRIPKDASSEEYDSSWGRRQRQALKLAHDMVKQGERVVDLIEPIDALINNEERYLLPASTSSAIDLYRRASTAPEPLTMLGDFEMEMAFPHDILGPIVYASQAISRESGIDLEIEGFDQDAEVPGVTVCTKYLIEAVTNVLDNAIKYAPSKRRGRGRPRKNSLPKIKVTLSSNEPPLEAGVTLYIEDNGPGIEKEDMERVFERGYRGRQVQGKINGNGLGLSMSAGIIRKMGGMLDLLEDGPSHLGGATIRIILFRHPTI